MGLQTGATVPARDRPRHGRGLARLHDDFVSSGAVDEGVRAVVSESWQRSVRSGVDPERTLAPVRLTSDDLALARQAHPLARALPVVRHLLVEAAADAGLLVAISDAAGQLLWVEGDHALRSRAEAMHFLPGADWSEASAGTNAPGTALALGRPVQIVGAEHLLRAVTPWSCSAAPIRDPAHGTILGVLDLTGGPHSATPQTLALVRATVAAVEAELRLQQLSLGDPTRQASAGRPQLAVLGRRQAMLHGAGIDQVLSLRHSEIVLLLSQHPDGLSSAELAVELSDDDLAPVTVRAELSRLRLALGPLELSSKPYRLPPLVTDLGDVWAELEAGRLSAAVARYRGPVLPASHAPGVVRLRDDLHRGVRGRLLAGGDPDALLAFADTPFGRDDLAVWSLAAATMPPSSPRRPEVHQHLHALDRALR
ncbi:GAF domain-containing protein [Micropruina sonneratiae]|uniref:GAF domain-containing protein n=1 Tax=Micropruina sonneratiae TaxID=2986940 RepID=UPI00222735C6|nr:GAF domain-containing protein [Micropruina sp. KQZ13P-5]MCW3157849.1 GAF domain-containing protein [Micropruina sp. KQZ13P-5]